MNIRLNCDAGESFGIWKMGKDEELMPYISMANLACGFHAADSLTMNRSVELAKKYNVTIGAHASYQDLIGFGRRSMVCSLEEIKSIILHQLGALSAFAKSHNVFISYLKPHGALYNDMMRDENIFKAILSAISSFDKNIKLMIISSPKNEAYNHTSILYGIELLYEIFPDRNYDDEGNLISRIKPEAIITDELDIMERVSILVNNGYINSLNGNKLFLNADTISVHGDADNTLSFIKTLKKVLI